MTGPSNCKRTNWKWRDYHNAGRIEFMTEIQNYLRGRILHHKDLANRIGRPHDSVQRELEDALEFVERDGDITTLPKPVPEPPIDITEGKEPSTFWCFLYHKWGNWLLANRDVANSYHAQYRVCKRCGYTQISIF